MNATVGDSGGSVYYQKTPTVLTVVATVNRILSCAVHVFSFQDVFVV